MRRPSRPRSDEFVSDELKPTLGGYIDVYYYPDEIFTESDEEVAAWRAEVKAKMERKRPLGFAAWPDETPQ